MLVDAKPAASSTAIEPTFAEFQSLKAGKTKSEPLADAVSAGKDEPSPDSEPDKSQEARSSEGKTESERQKARDSRREQRWYEERGEMRARLKLLEDQLQAKGGQPAKAQEPQGKPVKREFIAQIGEGKKYPDYETADEAYEDAKEAYLRKDIRSEFERDSEQKAHTQTASEIKKDFNAKVKQFAKTNEDFDDAFEAVAEAFDKRSHLNQAILKSQKPGELIMHLADNPEILQQLAGLPPSEALMEFGVIAAQFKADAKKEQTQEKPDAARSPSSVRARGEVPNLIQSLKKASESGMAEFRAQKQAAIKAGTKF